MHIEQQFDKYLKLELPERYLSLNEIYLVLMALKERDQLGDFIPFFEQVLSHLKEMEGEIEKYLISLPTYCVNEKCMWQWKSTALKKILHLDYNHEKLLKRLIDIKEIRMKYQNYFEGIEAGLDICDEAMCQGNKKIVSKYLNDSLKEIELFKEYSIMAGWFIRISCYAYYIGEMKCANEMFKNFEKSNVSIDHFSNEIKKYHYFLLTHLNPLI